MAKTTEELADFIERCFPQNRGVHSEALKENIKYILAQGREEGAREALRIDGVPRIGWKTSKDHYVNEVVIKVLANLKGVDLKGVDLKEKDVKA